MDKTTIMQRLARILQETYGVDSTSLEPSTKLADIGIDSMISADLMMEVEDVIGFRFETMDMPRDATVQDVADLIERNLAATGPQGASPQN